MPKIMDGADNYIDLRGRGRQPPMCPTCQVYFHPFDHGFPGRAKSRYDLSTTTEHMDLVSPRMKDFLQDRCTSPLDFFETGGGFFVLRPQIEVVLDMRGFFIEGTALCKTCGEPNGVYSNIGGDVKILPGQRPIGPMDLVRSRQRFAERRQRNFLLIVGDQLEQELLAQGFKGIIIRQQPYELSAFPTLANRDGGRTRTTPA
jgi:hypothetical protein